VLFWTPENSKTPTSAIVALVVIVLAGLALVFFVRKRRRGSPGSGPANKSERTVREAW
jgi:LPXTG-motif cell wall-anchored protein